MSSLWLDKIGWNQKIIATVLVKQTENLLWFLLTGIAFLKNSISGRIHIFWIWIKLKYIWAVHYHWLHNVNLLNMTTKFDKNTIVWKAISRFLLKGARIKIKNFFLRVLWFNTIWFFPLSMNLIIEIQTIVVLRSRLHTYMEEMNTVFSNL